MSSKISSRAKPKSSRVFPTEWSEWTWDSLGQRFWQCRLDAKGEYEYQYQSEERYNSSPPLESSTSPSQQCGDTGDNPAQVSDLGGVSRELESTHKPVSRQNLHSAWSWPKSLQKRSFFDRETENQPYIEWLQRNFVEDVISGAEDEDEEGEEEEDDGDENGDENGPFEQCREMEQAQNQRVSTRTYQTIRDQTGNPFTSHYWAPPSLSTKSCYEMNYLPSIESAGSQTARRYLGTHRDPGETLDLSFRVDRSNEFYFGRVFKVLWSEPSDSIRTGYTATYSTAYPKTRRFVMMREQKRHSICIPILTYGSQGITKNRVHPEDHAVFYTSRHAEYGDKGCTNPKDIHCPKCCQNCSARGEANADSAVDPCNPTRLDRFEGMNAQEWEDVNVVSRRPAQTPAPATKSVGLSASRYAVLADEDEPPAKKEPESSPGTNISKEEISRLVDEKFAQILAAQQANAAAVNNIQSLIPTGPRSKGLLKEPLLPVNPKTNTCWFCPDCSHAKCVSCGDRLTEQSAMPLRHLHYNKAHIVEHNLKVCFTGSMDQANVDQLLRGNPAWVQSDAGENIPVIMEEQTCSCLTCRRRHFLVAEDDKVPKKMAALLAISSGVLMSSSFVWLNTRMDLYEPSMIMKKLIIAATRYDVSGRLQHMIPNEMIFAFFLLGTAGLTGTTIALFHTRRQFGPVFIMTLAGTVASWVLGFSVEEIILVCLPLIIGCVILCSCTFGWKRTMIVDQDEKELLKSEV